MRIALGQLLVEKIILKEEVSKIFDQDFADCKFWFGIILNLLIRNYGRQQFYACNCPLYSDNGIHFSTLRVKHLSTSLSMQTCTQNRVGI